MSDIKVIAVIAVIVGIAVFIGGIKIGLFFGQRRKLSKSARQSLRVRGGNAAEQIAPLLPNFCARYNPSDCCFFGGKPIDYVVFKGMSEKNITEVIFLEIKSGRSKSLNPQEKRLKEVIEAKRVGWQQFNVDVEWD